MEGNLVVNEEREKVNKFQKWYQEKLVDTNISQTVEKGISGSNKIISGATKLIYDAAGTICLFIPGAQIAAPICAVGGKLNSKFVEFSGNATLTSKRFIEGKIIGVDGSSKDVVLPKFNKENISKDITELATDTISVIGEVEGAGKSL